MSEIVNKSSLAGDKYMSEMHLKQPGFTYSACDKFSKSKVKTQKFDQTAHTNYIYENNLYKPCFKYDMACGKYRDLNKRTKL